MTRFNKTTNFQVYIPCEWNVKYQEISGNLIRIIMKFI